MPFTVFYKTAITVVTAYLQACAIDMNPETVSSLLDDNVIVEHSTTYPETGFTRINPTTYTLADRMEFLRSRRFGCTKNTIFLSEPIILPISKNEVLGIVEVAEEKEINGEVKKVLMQDTTVFTIDPEKEKITKMVVKVLRIDSSK